MQDNFEYFESRFSGDIPVEVRQGGFREKGAGSKDATRFYI